MIIRKYGKGTEDKNKEKLKAYLLLVTGIICIGFSAIFVRFAGVPGPVSAFYRVLIAGSVIIPWWAVRTKNHPSLKQVILITAGGIFFALDLALWNTSLLLTSAATATLLANNAPLWVGLGALIIFREKLPGNYWAGLAISLAGMIILVGVKALFSLQMNAGDLLAIAASIFYAAYLLTTQRARAKVDTLTFMAFSIFSSILVLLLINLFLKSNLINYPAEVWASLLGLGLISHLGGWLSINYALGHLRASSVSVSLLAQVIVTSLLAIPLLGEGLEFNQIMGGLLVLGGIYYVNRR